MERFPSLTIGHSLEEEDFSRFSKAFSESILERIPTAKGVSFIVTSGQLGNVFPEIHFQKVIGQHYQKAVDRKLPVKVTDDSILLPFLLNQGNVAVAFIYGIDPLVVQRAGADWLVEIQHTVFLDFIYLKQARIDPETGLFNSANLYALLDNLDNYTDLNLILIELPPRLRSPRDAFQNAKRAAAALQEFSGKGLVHHIGQCVFAILLQHQDALSGTSRFGSSLVSSLKREGYHRVHIGSSSGEGKALNLGEKKQFQERLLTEAWTALQTAGRRGPFSFCDYSVLKHPEKHPLNLHKDSLIRKIRKRYRDAKSFCLMELKSEENADLVQLMKGYVGEGDIFAGEDTVVVFLNLAGKEQARAWLDNLLQKMTNDTKTAIQVSAGLAFYPFVDFRKSEILANCRKALLHAAFFGPGSITDFDAVSLNISGDIYYSEGDLPNAVREYRRGLVCETGNVNLLNSLGVAYAMMNKASLARENFKKALAVEPENFMSLYNLGLGEVLRGNASRGLQCFEKAVEAHSVEDGLDILRDLQFQLGKLYCRLGFYDKCLEVLTQWHESCDGSQSGGRVLRYLGEACYGLGRMSEAIVWLQKALRHDEIDPDALSLLGLAYLKEGEGNEIALSLCEKGLELSPGDTSIRLRLAKVQIECGLFVEARKNLMKCRNNRRFQAEIQFCLGKICLKLGRKRQARDYFGKVLQQNTLPSEILQEVHAVLEN